MTTGSGTENTSEETPTRSPENHLKNGTAESLETHSTLQSYSHEGTN